MKNLILILVFVVIGFLIEAPTCETHDVPCIGEPITFVGDAGLSVGYFHGFSWDLLEQRFDYEISIHPPIAGDGGDFIDDFMIIESEYVIGGE